MSGIFDALQGMMGRADPSAQLYAALGQAPGQPGSPAGAQPGAGDAGAPSAGGGPSGGPQQQQPQVYQSPPDLAQGYMALAKGGQGPSQAPAPPDLAQMYMAAQQRDQASNQFYSGLGLLAAGMYPGRNPNASMKWAEENQRDPSSLFQNFVQLKQYEQQNQALQAYRAGVPGMLKGFGLTDEQVKAYTPLAQADPSFGTKIAETQLGVTGGPAWMAQMRAEKAYTDAGQPVPWTPHDPVSFNAYNLANTASNVGHAKEMQDFKDSGVEDLATVEPRFDKGEKTVDTLLGNMDATMKALQAPGFLTRGPVPGYLGGGPYGQDVKDAAAAMATLQAQLAGEGLKNTKNVRNVREFNALKESMTAALDPSNSQAQVQQALQDIKSGIARAHAQALAVAGKQVPYAYKGLADPRYFIRGGPYDTGATQEEAPADSGGGGGGQQQNGGGSGGGAPPVPGAKKAPDGNWYIPDPARPGKYQRVD